MAILFKIAEQLQDVELPLDLRVGLVSSYGKPQEEFLTQCIKEYRDSLSFKQMIVGENYFYNKPDILNRQKYYIDRQGCPVKTDLLSNSKLCHPFMRKLVNQKINYLLSKDFTIRGDSNYCEYLSSYFDDKFRLTLTNVGSASVCAGIAWMQVYYNDKGELKFKHIPSQEVIPFWHDSEHTELDAIIRIYDEVEYQVNSADKKVWEIIEYYTPEGVWRYKRVKLTGHIIPLTQIEGEGHFTVDGKPAVWEKVPFVAFKYNRDEISLINWIKPLIDDYDLNTSDNSNNLQDIPNAIKVIKGYEDNDKQEFSKNLSVFRNVFVGEGGDVTSLETPVDVDSSDIHLTRLRKDIFEFGGGVDTVNKELRDVSGVALRFQYADLDMDCSEMAQQYKYSLRQLQWFINEDLQSKGVEFDDSKSDFLFNTAVILNETEIINNLAVSAPLISKRTIIDNHPFVKNTDEELDNIEKEQKQQLDVEAQQLETQAKIEKKYEVKTETSSNNNNQ